MKRHIRLITTFLVAGAILEVTGVDVLESIRSFRNPINAGLFGFLYLAGLSMFTEGEKFND